MDKYLQSTLLIAFELIIIYHGSCIFNSSFKNNQLTFQNYRRVQSSTSNANIFFFFFFILRKFQIWIVWLLLIQTFCIFRNVLLCMPQTLLFALSLSLSLLSLQDYINSWLSYQVLSDNFYFWPANLFLNNSITNQL